VLRRSWEVPVAEVSPRFLRLRRRLPVVAAVLPRRLVEVVLPLLAEAHPR
jgi:hypothetical protein